ncbi:MAG TPA: histidine kinase dimerization/phosphoacceptor domain -containing protein [Allosphingosinicella sp.]|jgi:chemotaxis protein methyltransferase CheR
MKQFDNLADAQTLALAIVDTLPEPFVVLDDDLRVLAASRCFYEHFKEDPARTRGRPFFELGDGQWDMPALRMLIETIVPEHTSMDNFEVEHDFLHLGRRTMLLNARLVRYEVHSSPNILIAFKDITARRSIEREKQELLEHTERLLARQQTLLREMEHRIANSLQIIASILLLKAGAVGSEETRLELRDAHKRVMSVAAVQSHLHSIEGIEGIEGIDIAAYLSKLSAGLAASMIGPHHGIEIEVVSDEGTLQSSEAVSLGLIVTELVINAIKYAFPTARAGARIVVTFEFEASAWKLSVDDNGAGRSPAQSTNSGGLGTAIVAALAKQLNAEIREVSSAGGLRVEITQPTFASHLPLAA